MKGQGQVLKGGTPLTAEEHCPSHPLHAVAFPQAERDVRDENLAGSVALSARDPRFGAADQDARSAPLAKAPVAASRRPHLADDDAILVANATLLHHHLLPTTARTG